MTSTRTNRTPIAATLLGLLAAITGTRAQADLGLGALKADLDLLVPITGTRAQADLCVCSPLKYQVSFDLTQDCLSTDEIAGLPGIADANQQCNFNPDLNKVTHVQITEINVGGDLISQYTQEFDPSVTSGTVDYTSVSYRAILPDLDLEYQLGVIPGGILVDLFGTTDEVTLPISRALIYYTNECGSGPIVFNDSGLGNIELVSTTSICFVSTALYPRAHMLIIGLTSLHTYAYDDMFDR
jgi:hypothetical protein